MVFPEVGDTHRRRLDRHQQQQVYDGDRQQSQPLDHIHHLRVHFLPSELGSRTATMRSRFPTLNTIRALRRRPELLFRRRPTSRKDMPSNVLHYFLGTCNIAYTLGVAKYHKCALIGYYSSSPSWLLAILAHRADFTSSVGD